MLLALLVSVAAMASPLKPLKVVIDPGHGGSDDGAVYGEAREADIVLKVAYELKKLLDADPKFTPILTRSSNVSVGLEERVDFAIAKKADLFVSIHANASTDARAYGVEFYFQNQLPPDEETLFLANNENHHAQVAKERSPASEDSEPSKKNDVLAILDDLGKQHRLQSSFYLSKQLLASWNADKKTASTAIRQAPFRVVSKTNTPSVLIELGFLTNPEEAQKLVSPAYQREVAQKIHKGLAQYRKQFEN